MTENIHPAILAQMHDVLRGMRTDVSIWQQIFTPERTGALIASVNSSLNRVLTARSKHSISLSFELGSNLPYAKNINEAEYPVEFTKSSATHHFLDKLQQEIMTNFMPAREAELPEIRGGKI